MNSVTKFGLGIGVCAVLGLAVGCEDKGASGGGTGSATAKASAAAPASSSASASSSAAAPASASASAASADSAAPAASAAEVAPPKCPTGYTGYGSPAFCMKLPKDYAFGSVDKTGDKMGTIHNTGPGTFSVFYSDAPIDNFYAQMAPEAKNFGTKIDKTGDLKNGKWFSYVSKDDMYLNVIIGPAKLADGTAVNLQCRVMTPAKKPDNALLDACKSISLP
jgi:hypothetical protein